MSLKEVSLDPFLMAGIYRQPLIKAEPVSAEISPVAGRPVPSLGNNRQRWLLVIHNPEEAYLNEEIFNMLLKLLNACKLTLDDIALINTAHLPETGFPIFRRQFSPRKIILFGQALAEMTDDHPKNKAWEENGIHLLRTDSLKDMYRDQSLKMPFWNALKDFLSV